MNDKTGAVADAVEIQCSKMLDNRAMGQIISQVVKSAGSRRDAWLTFLAGVFQSSRLDGFKGTGDRSTGKVSKEFKSAVRDAETDHLRALVADGSIKLGKGEPEAMLQAFASELREDKNYSNVKVTANRYFALVGANVFTGAGYLIPVEVMKEQIAEVCDKVAIDNSVSAKLKALVEPLSVSTIDGPDAIDSLFHAKALVAKLEGIVSHYAELATNQRVQPQPGDVVDATNAFVAKAQAAARLVQPGFAAKLEASRATH